MPVQKMLKLNRADIKKSFVDPVTRESAHHRGKLVTDEAFDAVMAVVDQDAIIQEEDTAITSEVWDKQTPINDVSAARMISNFRIGTGADVFILKREGAVILFQPHVPGVPGRLWMMSNAQQAADDVRQERANELAMYRIRRRLAEELDKA